MSHHLGFQGPPVPRERATVEFVRHYRLMVEATSNDPSALARALDEHPDLGPSVKRLGEIVLAVDRHRRTAQHRYIPQAHPDFHETRKDFDRRWRQPYDDLRDRMYMQALSRISQEFVRAYQLLIERAGNDPNAVEHICEADPGLSDQIGVLQEIDAAVDDRRREFEPFLPEEFRGALADFRKRWALPLLRTRAVSLNLDDI
jgi:hypothetical protein